MSSKSQDFNQNIISEFERLVKFIQEQIDNTREIKDKKQELVNNFRHKQIKNVLNIIKKFPKKITNENISEFNKIQGIGKGTIDRIKEIIKTGKLSELANFKETINPKNKILEDLESIVGVGRALSSEFVKMGITSVEDLKNKIKSKEIIVNDKILLGLKYYGKYMDNIPRNEITKVNKIIKKEIDKINKDYNLDNDSKYLFEICGSYRREKLTSGDIDVLISKIGTSIDKKDKVNHLEIIIKRLKKNIKSNDNQPLLVDDITDKSYETKYMGFAKYKNKPFRRIDIRFVSYDVFPSALLYFTGSAELNIKMRKIANKQKLKLSEYGLTKEDGTRLSISSEYDIFKILKIEYLAPNLR
jgi:DNA polymerase/3'-5' exonuclease PolX